MKTYILLAGDRNSWRRATEKTWEDKAEAWKAADAMHTISGKEYIVAEAATWEE